VCDDDQQPQPAHGLTRSVTHPHACCERCRLPGATTPDAWTHLRADKMGAKRQRRLRFAAPPEIAIALPVWLQ
ncbi:ethanolamine utilization cobalamin adenosyltransferase, partial [Salmonella enterica subsp. enterica serovar Schwarzengrund]